MFRVLCAFLLVGCGNKDDAYTPDTSLGMGDQGCYVTPSIDGEEQWAYQSSKQDTFQ